MKLANELDFVVEKFKQIKNLEEYAEALKKSGKYDDFEKRLGWDCLRATVNPFTICQWYDEYGCTDDHITTLVKTALKIARGGT
jgi:hypothetical protein